MVLKEICGWWPKGRIGVVCVEPPGHKGDHRLVANSPASLRKEGVIG